MASPGEFTYENAKADRLAAEAAEPDLAAAEGEEVPEPSASAPAASPAPAVPRRASPVNPATETG